jgi:alpha-N-arabinofuranosidase
MRRASPGLKLTAVGSNPGEVDWNMTVLERSGQHIDFIALHGYYGTDDFASTVAGPVYVERRARMLQSAIELASFTAGITRPIRIAFDEWNVWYRTRKDPQHLYEEVYELKDGLFVAGTLNSLFRMCGFVTMANLAQMVNALGMIHVDRAGMVLSPIWHAFDLYVNHTGGTVFDCFVMSDTFDTHDHGGPRGLGPLTGVPYVDASATLRQDGGDKLCLAVVNRHRDSPIECSIELSGFRVGDSAAVYELSGPSVDAINTVEAPRTVAVQERRMSVRAGSTFVHAFEPHSATVLELPLLR